MRVKNVDCVHGIKHANGTARVSVGGWTDSSYARLWKIDSSRSKGEPYTIWYDSRDFIYATHIRSPRQYHHHPYQSISWQQTLHHAIQLQSL